MIEKITRAAPDHIPAVDRTAGPLPLSGAQRALYLVELLHPGTPMYNITVAIRLEGPLNVPHLRNAVARVVARHEALRTTFTRGTTAPFEPAQRINTPYTDLPLVELNAADGAVQATADAAHAQNVTSAAEDLDAAALRLAQTWADEPFDLERGPLLRTRLLKVEPDRHLLVVTMHQLISDGRSLQVFFDTLAEEYARTPQATDPIPSPADTDPQPSAHILQFVDYAAWQRRRPIDADQLDWWRDRLAGVPTVLRLPTDRHRPAVAGPHGGSHCHALRSGVMEPALRLAQDLRVTPFVLVLTAYATFLSRLADTSDVLVGVPVSARDRAELDDMIGFFATTLPVLVQAGPDRSFADLCRSVQSELLDVLTHQDVTMEQLAAELAPERDPGHAPLVQAFFSLEQEPVVSPRLPGLRATAFDLPPSGAKADLDMMIFRAADTRDDFDMTITYRTDLFEATTIALLVAQFERLLAAAVADPTAPLASLPGPIKGVPPLPYPARPDVPSPPPVPAEDVTGPPRLTPRPAQAVPHGAPAASAGPAMEQHLVEIWREVLGREDVGLDDNFFDLGGTSFALATVHTLIGTRTGATTPLVSLLEFPTITTLARHLTGDTRTEHPVAQPTGQARTARLRDRRTRLQQRRPGQGTSA
ncbi:condensation domain-containing protein [Streptomyces cadmiisoli]|uniref:condensation domain-containing protein n=1 Tax=Streptomyces cadmiisoli TaxID=2184053 RepID=UPI003D757EA2